MATCFLTTNNRIIPYSHVTEICLPSDEDEVVDCLRGTVSVDFYIVVEGDVPKEPVPVNVEKHCAFFKSEIFLDAYKRCGVKVFVTEWLAMQ